jgi:hypothetical protein
MERNFFAFLFLIAICLSGGLAYEWKIGEAFIIKGKNLRILTIPSKCYIIAESFTGDYEKIKMCISK